MKTQENMTLAFWQALTSRPNWRRSDVAYHGRPFPDMPPRNKAVPHIRIIAGESLGSRRILSREHQHGALEGIGQGSRHHHLAAFEGFPGQPQVLAPELRAPVEIIRRGFVEEEKMFHRLCSGLKFPIHRPVASAV